MKWWTVRGLSQSCFSLYIISPICFCLDFLVKHLANQSLELFWPCATLSLKSDDHTIEKNAVFCHNIENNTALFCHSIGINALLFRHTEGNQCTPCTGQGDIGGACEGVCVWIKVSVTGGGWGHCEGIGCWGRPIRRLDTRQCVPLSRSRHSDQAVQLSTKLLTLLSIVRCNCSYWQRHNSRACRHNWSVACQCRSHSSVTSRGDSPALQPQSVHVVASVCGRCSAATRVFNKSWLFQDWT